jgi:hypothetical protein
MSRKPITHPVPGELIVATDLAATGKPRTVRRYFAARECRTGVTECPADVGADVAPGPTNWRWCRRHIDRSFPRQIAANAWVAAKPIVAAASNINERPARCPRLTLIFSTQFAGHEKSCVELTAEV